MANTLIRHSVKPSQTFHTPCWGALGCGGEEGGVLGSKSLQDVTNKGDNWRCQEVIYKGSDKSHTSFRVSTCEVSENMRGSQGW